MNADDLRSPRERLLAMAKAAAELRDGAAKRRSVLGIIRDSFAPQLVMIDGKSQLNVMMWC
jgi:hypothetical protein